MTSMDPTAADNGMERDPQMVSGTTGLGNDVNADPGLSGSVAPGSLSTADPNMVDELGADSDSVSDLNNDSTTVSGGPDLGGTMGGTGGMNEGDRHVLDSDALEIDDGAAMRSDSGTGSGIGADAQDLTTGTGMDGGDSSGGYGGAMSDQTGSMASGADQDTGGTAYYGGNTDDPAGNDYMSDTQVDDTTNDDGSGI